MDLALLADLRDLTVDLGASGYTRTTLAMLERDLLRNVPSALGATVALLADEPGRLPIEVHLVARTVRPDEIASALQVPLARLAPTVNGSITFWAGEPGALGDLAADLVAAFGLVPVDVDQDPDRPRGPLAPTVEGLQDFSLVNRALGVLMNRGHTLAAARAELDRRAALRGLELVAAARAVIGSAYV